jgi:hypothetical protein
MLKKKRIPIPIDSATEILYLSDRTCCICNERGKNIQIHHIDDDPSNNALENLSVLCLECHNQTMIKGGFGRQLDAKQVLFFRSKWLERVKNRKDKADEIASLITVSNENDINKVQEFLENDLEDYTNYQDSNKLKQYLERILIIHKAQLMIAQTSWDRGITSIMNQANYDMVAFYQEVLVELSSFYVNTPFENNDAMEYFGDIISSRFSWYRFVLEPRGMGTGGTMISTMVGGSVMSELKNMVLDMVLALEDDYMIIPKLDYQKWKETWLQND